ncbi:MAG TPA: phytanoyl-CoA dioxygenase family protein [Rhizomicrobium sp.]|nr:phytanoyl-CoA dioxygenase family protein [Rhizomicrobium sp.]
MALVAQSKAPPSNQALERIMGEISALGLEHNLIELETLGYTTIKGVLSPATVERAKEAIIRSTEKFTGKTIDTAREDGTNLNGMTYIPYLLYDDPVFEEIVMEVKPLALVTYLLGESCLLSSMGCHFRVPGGLPLMLHSDNGNGTPAPFSNTAFVANVNYALTPYSREAGCLAMVPGSHKLLRQPTLAENFRAQRGPGEPLECATWSDPPNVVPMTIAPGDAVVWHGNTWHGGFKREVPGARINLAAYFCRQFVQTQEQHGRAVPRDLLARHANDERFSVLLGQRAPYGWRGEGPDYALMGKSPRGQYD